MKDFLKILASVVVISGSVSYIAIDSYKKEKFIIEEVRTEQEKIINLYLENNLTRIMQEQSEKLETTLFKEPIIKVGLLEIDKNKLSGITICGVYYPISNTIYLRKDITIEKEKDGLEVITKKKCKIKPTLDHEIRHYFNDMLSESLGKGNWPLEGITEYQEIALQIISEGIAGYAERKMNVTYDSFEDKEWPKSYQGFWNFLNPDILDYRIRYDGGYHLVQPIIDKYGEEGIKHLMFNPPNEQELLDLKSYQQKVLQFLNKD